MSIPYVIKFYFEADGTKYKNFRANPWYKAIFEALHEKSSNLRESILTLDITTYIKQNHPALFREVEKDDVRFGKKIGSCLSQLKNWGIFKSNELAEKGIRQKQFQLNEIYADYLTENITRVFLQ